MRIVLTQFAIDNHFDSTRAGTKITDRSAEQFGHEAREYAEEDMSPGYAPFCKLAFITNWTNTRTGTIPITADNKLLLRSEYKARKDSELPVLVRWFEAAYAPVAEYLCLVLYDREQLAKEGTDIGDADHGVVAILAQMHNQEEPINPATMMRNALGVEEGGSGVAIDREAYLRSVEFWNQNAAVKS